MFASQDFLTVLALIVAGSPALLLVLLGGASILGRPFKEDAIRRLIGGCITAGLVASLVMCLAIVVRGTPHVTVALGNWIVLPTYHFSVKLLFDPLSLPFVILTYVLCGTIGAFANRYMHREPGFNRFFVLLAMFVMGMVTTSLAGTIETLFAGWELVGLSSALLIAFFQERQMPVRNGLRVWIVYRVSDAALLIGAVLLHHLGTHGDFDALLGAGAWPGEHANISPQEALWVGLLLVVAAAGKSALIPFSGWLPRAMEGPTPSSAVYYGALSVHLGAYLLLRVSPIIELAPGLREVVIVLGLATALLAALAARVQTDIKSALSFASLTQVGLIVAEIGFGFYWIALVHMIGHACLRTLQFLRAPTLLQDYRLLENAIGTNLPRPANQWPALHSNARGLWVYRLAIERGYLDAYLMDYVARPVVAIFRWFDGLERKWTDLLTRGPSRESDQLSVAPELVEELL